MSRIFIVGSGVVGSATGRGLAAAGHTVTFVDIAPARLAELADEGLDARPALDLAGEPESFIFLTLPTPNRGRGYDLTALRQGAEDVGRALAQADARHIVVVRSTVPPGTTEDVVRPILEDGSGLTAGEDFFLGYSPERIDPGNTTWTLVNTPKLVAGINAESAARINRFYRRLVKRTVLVPRPAEAELAKLLENTYRHVNIALVNELAIFAAELGIDVWEAIDAAATKPFGYMRFDPGPGVGGHCLPVDPSYLSWHVRYALGRPARLIELANDINTGMPAYVVNRLVLALNERSLSLKDRKVLLLGLSYKKNTGDARESPARAIATQLVALGARVAAADPCVLEADVPPGVGLVDLTEAEVAKADAIVLLVDHDQFDMASLATCGRLVLDCRRVLGGPDVEVL